MNSYSYTGLEINCHRMKRLQEDPIAMRVVKQTDSESSEGRESDDDAEDDPVTKKMVVVDDEIEETCGSWAVVVGSFFNMFLSLGTGLAVAPMVVEWLRTFNMGQEVTAWVGSINLGVLFLLGPVVSALTIRFSARSVSITGSLLSSLGLLGSAFSTSIYHLYLLYGVLTGLGYCMMFVTALGVVPPHFGRRRTLAAGLASIGTGVGTWVMPLLTRPLMDHYTWRGAMIILSGINLNGVVFGALYQQPRVLAKVNSSHKNRSPLRQLAVSLSKVFTLSLLKDVRFVIFALHVAGWQLGQVLMMVLFGDFVKHRGLSGTDTAQMLSVFGLGSALGRILSALTADVICSKKLNFYNTGTIMRAVAMFLVPSFSTYWPLMFLMLINGMGFGFEGGTFVAGTTQLTGVRKVVGALGYVSLTTGVGCLVGPPYGGWLFLTSNGYSVPFYFGASVTLFSSLVCFLVVNVKCGAIFKCCHRRSQPEVIYSSNI